MRHRRHKTPPKPPPFIPTTPEQLFEAQLMQLTTQAWSRYRATQELRGKVGLEELKVVRKEAYLWP